MKRSTFGVLVTAGVLIGTTPGHAALAAGEHAVKAHLASVTVTPPAPGAATAIAFAVKQLGCPYTWGGNGPCSSGWDCSGLVTAAWAKAGITIPRTSETEWASLRRVPAAHLKPGDLGLYAGADGTASSPGHVVMYVGGGKVVQAYGSGVPVEITPVADVNAGAFAGWVRP